MQDSRVDEAIAIEQQHALFSMLPREDPVHWTEPYGYSPFWTVSKHKDVMEIEKQNDKISMRRAPSSLDRIRIEREGRHEQAAYAGPCNQPNE